MTKNVMNMNSLLNILKNSNQMQQNVREQKRSNNVSRATATCQRIRRETVAKRTKKRQRALRQIMNNSTLANQNHNMSVRPTRKRTIPNRLTYQTPACLKTKRKQTTSLVPTKTIKKQQSESQKKAQAKAAITRMFHKQLKQNVNNSNLVNLFGKMQTN